MSERISSKTISSDVILYQIALALMINTCIFLVLKSTLSRRLGTGFIDFKYVIGALVDLFNSCQLYISYIRHVKLFLRALIKEKICHYLPGDMGEGL